MATIRGGNTLSPKRVIDSDCNVKNQNTDMKKLTGVDTDISDVKCHEHLACSDCQTGECPLNQLQKETEKTELRYEDSEVIIREVTGELPNGETKHFSMVAEPIADESGEVAEMVQSFIGMTELK